MKYWGFLLAKLAAAGLLMWAALIGICLCFRHPAIFLDTQPKPFGHDLGFTLAMMLFFLCCAGLFYLIVWDHRYRCRICLRRLRMPVFSGSWPNMLLFGRPRTEYICFYGHGTLRVPEVRITGPESPDWQAHDEDIWKELESFEETRR